MTTLILLLLLQLPSHAPICMRCPMFVRINATVVRVGNLNGLIFRNCSVLVESNKKQVEAASGGSLCGLLKPGDVVTVAVWQGGARKVEGFSVKP